MILAFDHPDACVAAETWRCNCGPSALAAALGLTLDQVRPHAEAVGFADRGYMNVSMMRSAIPLAGGRISREGPINRTQSLFPRHGLARIQWTGPWIKDGKAQRWAAAQTHWVASSLIDGACIIFDINAGLQRRRDWEQKTVPMILKQCVPRNDGGWFITHSWEVEKAA